MKQEFDETVELDEITFDIDAVSGVSSRALAIDRHEIHSDDDIDVPAGIEAEMSPAFRELADPTLPLLPREPRARLLMQSPTRLYFYWSTGSSPYAPLGKALGDASAYRLALRLLDLTHGTEELQGVEPDGSWWFDVKPDAEYRAEIGFYSPSRPFVRVLFSNTIKTPRKGPSPHRSSEARWMISTGKFADVLEASGFSSDALDVARTDDNGDFANRLALHIGIEAERLSGFDHAELRRIMEHLAAGTPIADFKWRISAELYALLEAHLAGLSAAAVHGDVDAETSADQSPERMEAFGGSIVNIKRPRYRPISSLSMR